MQVCGLVAGAGLPGQPRPRPRLEQVGNALFSPPFSTVLRSPGIAWPRQQFPSPQHWIQFAARAVAGALDYKLALDTRTLPVDMQAGKPLDMEQYFKIFGTIFKHIVQCRNTSY